MKKLNILEYFVLAAVWGGSFLLMRVAVPEFGPIWLIELRVLLASLVLLPLVVHQGLWAMGCRYWRELLITGALNSAVPFVLLAYTALSLPSGFTSILNATAPLFGAGIALVGLKEQFSKRQLVGLAMGFTGVVVLLGRQPAALSGGFLLAAIAGLSAALMYATAAPYARKHLSHLPALVITTGSQVAATVVLLPLLPFSVPSAMPSTQSMLAVLALALLSTAFAYMLYFRLIAIMGATRALTVGYLIPLFAMLWGALLLGEVITAAMGLGCGLILLGTAIANQVFSPTKS